MPKLLLDRAYIHSGKFYGPGIVDVESVEVFKDLRVAVTRNTKGKVKVEEPEPEPEPEPEVEVEEEDNPEDEEVDAKPTDDDYDYSVMSKAEIRALCKERGLNVSGKKLSEMIAALKSSK